jgi:isopenicillin-N epimerase
MSPQTDLSQQFLLDPDVTFLNFGSFGACPKPVFETWMDFQRQLEREPVQFILKKGPELLRRSREALGNFINCAADDLVYVPNPTFAMNIVAKNLDLQPGDEILSTDLEYGAMDRMWKYYCEKTGARYVRQKITLPLISKEQFIADFWKGFSEKTKAIFISQITSSTALIFPAKEICAEAKKRGLITIVDGAHVPAHIPLDLADLEADYYTGACHKWMMTPKGSSFLYVKRKLQNALDPLVISWGYDAAIPSHSQFLDYHEFNGTRDFSAYLTTPAAIAFMKEHNWWSVAAGCRKIVLDNVQRFCDLLDAEPLAPVTEKFFGQMASISVRTDDPAAMKSRLYDEFRIEVPVMPHGDKAYVRYSINAFNTQSDLDRLYDALKKMLAR